ncbi:MAG: rod shape-determining protein RodA [Thermoleophilia bacterium]|nr:rod shape-determining protein RodA [Thermoleophilia bacterium]
MNVLQKADQRPRAGFSLLRYLRNVDWILLLTTLGLTGYGMAAIYSATHADPNLPTSTYYVRSQALGLVVGLVAMVTISLIPFGVWARWRNYLYGFSLALLALTLAIGAERMGARRWIALPFFDLQSSELVKMAVLVAFAALLVEGVELRDRFRFVLKSVAFMAAPAVLIFIQPDLGTALVFGVMLAVMLVVWGIRWTHAAALAGAALAAAVAVLRVLPGLGLSLLQPYQIQRLLVFLDPEKDTSGAAYQLWQSKIAVASGMFTGKGFMEGTQTHLNFLPAHHTDFIFSVIGEELGFAGAMLLLGLFLIVAWRALRIAGMARNLFGTLIAAGVGSVVVFQVFVNVGMTIGIMPITGIPLPFVSFGSNSLVVFLTGVGLLESVHIHSRTALYGGRLKGEPYGQIGP